MTPRIVLACCSDAGYAPHAATMLYSALHRTPKANFDIHYLHDPEFPALEAQKIRQALSRFGTRLNLVFHAVPDSLVEGLPLFSHMKAGSLRPVMWYRLFLPQILPDAPKVLYLDCDTLVTDDLAPLWNTELGGYALAATSNPSWSSEADVNWHLQCGLQHAHDYFNSGVMLLNLTEFRARRWTDAVVEHGRCNADWIRYGDQDSMVAVLHAHRLPLAPRWNAMRIIIMSGNSRKIFTPAEMQDVLHRPGIIHFEGSTKPWMDPTKHPYARLHQRYARKLPWPVRRAWPQWQDLENLFIRKDWVRLRRLFQRVRKRLK